MSLPSNVSLDLSQVPALTPPPGVVPNFINPYTRGPMLLAMSAVAIGIMYLFMALRFYTKFYVRPGLTWDDVTCTLAALCSTGLFIGLIFLERAGMGTHQWNVRASRLSNDSYLKPLYIIVNLLPLVALFVKLTFYILFLQIFRPKPVFRWSIYISIFITATFYAVVMIILFVLTTPKPGVSFLDNFTKFLGKRTSPVIDLTLALGYFNIFSDVYILILPISGVISLNLPARRKIGVIFIFMTGLLAVVASTVSLYYRYQTNYTGNTTWHLMPNAFLTILEHTIGVDCSCMPACSVAIRRELPMLTKLKSKLTSRLRSWGASLTFSKSSQSRRFFSLSERNGSGNKQDPKFDANSGNGIFLGTLPKLPKRMHQMRTAREIFWERKNCTDTGADEAGNDISSSSTSDAAQQV